jgi:hypothetical protein
MEDLTDDKLRALMAEVEPLLRGAAEILNREGVGLPDHLYNSLSQAHRHLLHTEIKIRHELHKRGAPETVPAP